MSGKTILYVEDNEFNLKMVRQLLARTAYRLIEATAWLEPPLLGGPDGFLIETKGRVERPDDVDVADRAIREHNAFEQHRALHLGAHRFSGVLRFDFADHARQLDAVARPIEATARSTASPRAKPRSLARSDTCARSCARPAGRPSALRRRRLIRFDGAR